MNKIEFWLMNNPIRSLVQRYEAQRMRTMTGFRGGKVLEIGCGQGTGTLLIDRLFSPQKITAMDLDEKMIRRAKRRIWLKHVQFQQGDVTALDFKDRSFDAVFDFGILHHIPNWEVALKEVHRVLKPKGQFILEDLSIESFRLPVIGWLLRILLEHPYREMYLREDFFKFVGKNGFKVIAKRENPFWFNLVLEKTAVSQ